MVTLDYYLQRETLQPLLDSRPAAPNTTTPALTSGPLDLPTKSTLMILRVTESIQLRYSSRLHLCAHSVCQPFELGLPTVAVLSKSILEVDLL
jgi:hypothetical protein